MMRYESRTMTMEDVIQWMLQCLGDGIDFIEWGAPSIDISY